MATPLSAAVLVAALRAEGVTVVEVGNWRTHNRNSKGAWGPVHGSIVHHTVTEGTASTVATCRDGYAGLPGPLCHGVIAKNGAVHLVGYGRANHAGGGDPRVLEQVIDESYGTRPSVPTKGNSNGVDGNARFYGWECENLGDGKDPWPAAQYDAIVRVQAALIRAHRAKGDDWGLEAKSVIGHLEWSADKIDPRGFGMPALRADVAERLAHPASWNPGSANTPSEEDDMPLTVADLKLLATKDGVFRAPTDAADYSPDPADARHYWSLGTHVATQTEGIRAVRREVAANTAAITALAGLVGTGVDTAAVVAAVQAAITDAVIDVNINTISEA
ncbi:MULTISPECIES: peptidoglycan recognition protein family protein [Streptomyces]|uniref:N-acetylmuramoyl-L-alanine amidase n=1 Tax=Streptomyces flavovirens TaxID=52258 RepID=A0ABV8NDX9_9ACTN|nr:N-acetylmuramoyl-L-alanine amidase [Streptomyces sp. MBT51]MBK3592426.1 N-acetylmuramoyl-L-alanine amidase [Streptomyces sp. MBT51]